MNIKYKPLFILKYFCEDSNPVGVQSRNFINNLIKKGINPSVYTKQTGSFSSMTDKYDIHFIKEVPNKYLSWFVRSIFPDLILLPDIERFTYLPFLKRKLNLELVKNKYDWIHTVSNPSSNHLAGLYLKKKTNLPWIAQFYDPWIGNNYRKHKIKYFENFDNKLEYDIAVNADIIIHTNDIIKNDWIKRYGSLVRDKIHIFPICYDEKEIQEKRSRNYNTNKKLSILYVGALYLDRNLSDIIQAIKLLKIELPDLERKLTFTIIGDISTRDKENVNKNGLSNLFIFLGKKPRKELAEFYYNADVLLVIDAPAEENLFFPSKLIEYLTYNKPILAITPKIGITHAILNKTGHCSIENFSINEIVNYFRNLLNNYNQVLSFNKDYYKIFSAELQIDEYMKLINQRIIRKST